MALFPATFSEWSPENPEHAVAVLMSGGVDSSVTALLLRDEGWDVAGFTMKVPMADQCTHPSPCCGSEAAFVCKDLGIPHYFIDTEKVFEREIIAPFRHDYRHGLTPSPCIDCNTRLKFGLVWDLLEQAFAVKNLATGHYAKVINQPDGSYLAMGDDKKRDQSYFLYGVPQQRLAHLLLPMGGLEKTAVRSTASSHELRTSQRPDSMELCFAGEGDYRNALGSDLSPQGPICDTSGRVLGQHDGLHNFTVGQRRGIHVAGSEALYVLELDAAANRLVVGPQHKLLKSSLIVADLNILQPLLFTPGQQALVKVRSTMEPVECTIGAEHDLGVEIVFTEPIMAPAPGQHLVLYDDKEQVIAGGKIQKLISPESES